MLYKHMKMSGTISKDLIEMSETIFGTFANHKKWLVNHVQPFALKDEVPILNCMFSSKFIPYMQKQYCLSDDFYNQLQGKKILTDKGWEVNPACKPRKELIE